MDLTLGVGSAIAGGLLICSARYGGMVVTTLFAVIDEAGRTDV
jgi:hypothetical protein